MNIIDPQVRVWKRELDEGKLLAVERAARLCYKSEGKIGERYSGGFLEKIIRQGHGSVLEHEKVTVQFVTDRGVTHEIVRHRIGSYSQESTRYCNYAKERFGGEITLIRPYFFIDHPDSMLEWEAACRTCEQMYLSLLQKHSPQEARSVLPNSLKTEIAVTYNFREWRHFFRLRCAKDAHPQMRQVAIPLLLLLRKIFPPVFSDIPYDTDFPGRYFASVEIIRD